MRRRNGDLTRAQLQSALRELGVCSRACRRYRRATGTPREMYEQANYNDVRWLLVQLTNGLLVTPWPRRGREASAAKRLRKLMPWDNVERRLRTLHYDRKARLAREKTS